MNKTDIMSYAERISKALGYKPGDQLGPLVHQLNGKIQYHDDFAFENGVSGAIEVRDKESFTIYLPACTTSAKRDRFTFAHELGHYFLHSKLGEIPIKVNQETSTAGLLEWQANWFAGAFLMQQESVKELHTEGHSCSASADYFKVSEVAMRERW